MIGIKIAPILADEYSVLLIAPRQPDCFQIARIRRAVSNPNPITSIIAGEPRDAQRIVRANILNPDHVEPRESAKVSFNKKAKK